MRRSISFRHGQDYDFPELADVFSWEPSPERIDARAAFGYLLNLDEHPEMLPLAWHIGRSAIADATAAPRLLAGNAGAESVAKIIATLSDASNGITKSFLHAYEHDGAEEFIVQQLMPLQFIAGHWLQHYSRVATAHTPVAGKLNQLFAMQTMAYVAGDERNTGKIGNGLSSLFINFRESRRAREFLLHNETHDYAYATANTLLGFAQFPREFLPDILGITLAWHFLGIHAHVETSVLKYYLGSDLTPEHVTQLVERESHMKVLAQHAADLLVSECDPQLAEQVLARIADGANVLAATWQLWIEKTQSLINGGGASINEQMADIIRQKAPCAVGYHRNRKLGAARIDDLLDLQNSSAQDVLDALAASPLITPGDASRSLFVTRLVELGGPMVGIFSEREQEVIRAWIDALPQTKTDPAAATTTPAAEAPIGYPLWTKESYLAACREEYDARPCSLREIFYKLVNLEYFPDILPVAEEFLLNRLGRAYDTLASGERPIPSWHYRHDVIERWVFDKHREQIDAYEPLIGQPKVDKDTFVTATARLAPLLLIDGGWLQGTTAPHTLYSSTGEKLFRIFFEELGEGDAAMHHSNIYRELLEAMGVLVEDVTDLEFAFSERFPDEAYEVPVLWLSLSCFTRHYYPELLGINLAVELAGLGASYMEAHDTLKFYGFPTTFVDYHNTTDNASVGHAALSMNTIKLFMNEIMEREGPHRLNDYWRRIWTGMRLTLPANHDFTWRPTASTQLPARGALYTAQSSLFNRADDR